MKKNMLNKLVRPVSLSFLIISCFSSFFSLMIFIVEPVSVMSTTYFILFFFPILMLLSVGKEWSSSLVTPNNLKFIEEEDKKLFIFILSDQSISSMWFILLMSNFYSYIYIYPKHYLFLICLFMMSYLFFMSMYNIPYKKIFNKIKAMKKMMKYYVSFITSFCTSMSCAEFVAHSIRFFSISLRILINILSSHMIITLMTKIGVLSSPFFKLKCWTYSMNHFFIFTIMMMILESLISLVQPLLFTFLLSSWINKFWWL